MAYTRKDARIKIADLLRAHEYAPGKKTFALVWSAQMKETFGYSPVAMVWDGPRWLSTRRTADAAEDSAIIRVGVLVSRGDSNAPANQEENTENWLDRSGQAVLDVVIDNLSLDGYWNYIEFAGETYLDYPPIETGTQYRREIYDLRVFLGVGV